MKLEPYTAPTNEDLYRLYERVNKKYFEGSVYLQDIRYGVFLLDVLLGHLTVGVYFTNAAGTIYKIYINSALKQQNFRKSYPWFEEVVVHHELAHAMVMQNLAPMRLGVELLEDPHGPTWRHLMNKHPNCEKGERLLPHISGSLLGDARYAVYKILQKRKNIRLDITLAAALVGESALVVPTSEQPLVDLAKGRTVEAKDLLKYCK